MSEKERRKQDAAAARRALNEAPDAGQAVERGPLARPSKPSAEAAPGTEQPDVRPRETQ